MGAYLTAERKVEGIDATAMDGKALLKNLEKLDELAAARSASPLSSFLSFSPDELAVYAESLGGDIDPSKIEPEQWFVPDQLIQTVDILRRIVDDSPGDFILGGGLQTDLTNLDKMLRIAEKNRIRVHLTMDQP